MVTAGANTKMLDSLNQSLTIALTIPVVFWGVLFILDTTFGGRGSVVFLISGFLVTLPVLLVGLASANAALIVSIAIHSAVVLMIAYGNLKYFVEQRKKSKTQL